MKKILLLFLVFSLKAAEVTQEERSSMGDDEKKHLLYHQRIQATRGAVTEPIVAQPDNAAQQKPVMFKKRCCCINGIDPIEAGSFCCLMASLCAQCFQGM